MQFHLDKFEQAGATVVALCPQLQPFNEAIQAELGLGFPVLRDTNNAVSTAFGLTLPQPKDVIEAEQSLGLDLPAHNGTQSWDLPIPSRYVIDRSLRVRYASHSVDHRLRSDPKDCLQSMSSD